MPSSQSGSGALRPSEPALRSERHQAREQIRSVLSGDALAMVFQPVVDIRTGRVVGAEALARFNVEPYRTPDVWFGQAWSVGLGLELELAAVQRALASLVDMPADTYVAINTAPATLCSGALLEVLRGFPLGRVIVELTEHTRVDDYESLTSAIGRLRAAGARLSVDDAGAGFSSFQHVLRLRPDVIKLDRSLTTKIDDSPVRAALASALVTFAASLGAQICAEGIETTGELVALQKLGVAYGQGYLLARPARLPLPQVPTGVWTSRYARPVEAGAFMPSPAVRSAHRIDALGYTELLDSAAEEDFDRFTRLVVQLLRVPVALVSLVDGHRQFFKSAIGVSEPWSSARETPLTHSFCQHAVTTRLPLIIDDARSHPLVRDNCATTEIGAVAYAGVPILSADGQALGTLCAVDGEPRAWTAEEVASLEDLAKLVVVQIELRRARREGRERDDIFRRIFDQADAALLLCTLDGRVEHASRRLCELLGYEESELRNRPFTALEDPASLDPELASGNQVHLVGRDDARSVKRLVCKDGSRLAAITTTSVIHDASSKARFTIVTLEPMESNTASRPSPALMD